MTLTCARELADYGVEGAIERRPDVLGGVNVRGGAVVLAAVAEAHGLTYVDASTVLAVAA